MLQVLLLSEMVKLLPIPLYLYLYSLGRGPRLTMSFSVFPCFKHSLLQIIGDFLEISTNCLGIEQELSPISGKAILFSSGQVRHLLTDKITLTKPDHLVFLLVCMVTFYSTALLLPDIYRPCSLVKQGDIALGSIYVPPCGSALSKVIVRVSVISGHMRDNCADVVNWLLLSVHFFLM